MSFNATEKGVNSTPLVSLDDIDYNQFIEKDIPATIFLALISIIGTIGNVHTLLVYGLSSLMAKRKLKIFIMWLAWIDLTACLFCIPFEIFDIRYSYTFSSAAACKIFRFLNHVVTLASGGILTAIAIERRRVEHIRNKHISTIFNSNTFFHVTASIVVGVSILLSIPAFVFYGTNVKKVPEHHGLNVNGSDCTILSQYQNIRVAGSYVGIVMLLSIICCITCVVVYGKITLIIIRQIRKDRERHNRQVPNLSGSVTDLQSQETSVTYTGTVQMSTIENIRDTSMAKGTNSQNQNKNGVSKQKRSRYDKGRQLTISLIVATVVWFLGILLYGTTILVKQIDRELYNKSIRSVTAILLRAYFINNAANPVVFCFIDNSFRAECFRFYTRCFNAISEVHVIPKVPRDSATPFPI